MESKYSTEGNNEFYNLIEIGREETESSNISKDKKDALYQIFDETVKRHEKNKATYFTGTKYLEDHSKELERLNSSFFKLNSEIEKLSSISENNRKISKKTLSTLEKSCETSKNSLIRSKFPKPHLIN